jgi:hypothetical protein
MSKELFSVFFYLLRREVGSSGVMEAEAYLFQADNAQEQVVLTARWS